MPSRLVYRACARAGVTRVGPHALRRSLATETLRAGAPMSEVAQLLRHVDQATSSIYAAADLGPLPGREHRADHPGKNGAGPPRSARCARGVRCVSSDHRPGRADDQRRRPRGRAGRGSGAAMGSGMDRRLPGHPAEGGTQVRHLMRRKHGGRRAGSAVTTAAPGRGVPPATQSTADAPGFARPGSRSCRL